MKNQIILRDSKKKIYIRENGKIGIQTITDLKTEPSLTQQHQAADTDINTIMKRYNGNYNAVPKQETGFYADMTKVTDLRTAMHTVKDAEKQFLTLPSAVREKFQNDYTKLFDFVNDPKNDEEAIKLGLKNKKPDPPSNNELNEKKAKPQKPTEPKTDSSSSAAE